MKKMLLVALLVTLVGCSTAGPAEPVGTPETTAPGQTPTPSETATPETTPPPPITQAPFQKEVAARLNGPGGKCVTTKPFDILTANNRWVIEWASEGGILLTVDDDDGKGVDRVLTLSSKGKLKERSEYGYGTYTLTVCPNGNPWTATIYQWT